MFFTPYDLYIVPGILLALYAQYRVKSVYSKYSKVQISNHISGADTARQILSRAEIGDVIVEEHKGFLSDHYDPMKKRLRLSPENYHGYSIAAVGIAAHEAGHAIQHAEKYPWLKMRSELVPVTNIGSWIAFPLIFAGYFFNHSQLFLAGILFFSLSLVFTLITLPVEYDASRRAKLLLLEHGIITSHEKVGVDRVLDAAALTYLAAAITSLLQLLSLILQFRGRE